MTESRLLTRADLAHLSIPRLTVVEGPIGVGKTTLVKMLANCFKCDALLERAEENPFLERFYQGQKHAALSTQLFFLMQRAQQLSQLAQDDMFVEHRVADFLMDKDRLFAEVTLDPDELNLYAQVYDRLTLDVPKPDLVVYLQAPAQVLLQRIEHRGVAVEKSITRNYLDRLNEVYSRFFHFYDASPLLIVNATELDWSSNVEDFNNLVRYMLSVEHGRHYYNPQPSI